MCGRFALTASTEQIKQHFMLKEAYATLSPRYNIAPNQVVVMVKGAALDFATWGFQFANSTSCIINLRLENILEKTSFSVAFKYQRCLIVASGFFEWKTVNNKKIPYYVQTKNSKIIGLAGIWVKDHCVILTTAANSNDIHARMPVIINQDNYKLWLSAKTPLNLLFKDNIRVLLNELSVYRVSTEVNNPKFDNISCIEACFI